MSLNVSDSDRNYLDTGKLLGISDDKQANRWVLSAVEKLVGIERCNELLRACSHHVNSQPTALKKFRHSIGVNIWQTSPIAFQTSSKVLAPAFLR